MNEILQKLKGGDRRSIGRAHEVVQDVLQEPDLFGMVPRLPLNSAERQRWTAVLRRYLQDESKIVKTSARQDEAHLPEDLALLEKHTGSGSPAVQARGRLALRHAGLLAQLNSQ